MSKRTSCLMAQMCTVIDKTLQIPSGSSGQWARRPQQATKAAGPRQRAGAAGERQRPTRHTTQRKWVLI